MKKKFIGFYNPTKDEIEEAWNKGIFAFDANTLLNLYRYTDNTRTDFLNALKTIKDKLFLPFQAAYEYQNNRLEVIESIENSYEELYDIFPENFEKHLVSQINKYKKHPSILTEKIIKLHGEFLANLTKELNKQKTKHPDFRTKDDVLDELTDLFDNSVGEEFSKEDLLKIYKEGETRYLNEVPPGYKDLSNKKGKGQRHIYGDLIIWKELINNTKNKKQPLIFITDDRKEDWWTIQKGKTIRPREELIKEFFDITGIRILIYNADNFLLFAKEKGLLPKLKDETIEEVKDIRVSDEKHYKNINEALSIQPISTNRLSDILSGQTTYNPTYISDYLNAQSLSTKGISDILSIQSYKPSNVVSDFLKAQSSLTDFLDTQKNSSDYISDYLSAKKRLSDIIEDQTLSTKRLSDFISKDSKKPLTLKSETPKTKPKSHDKQDDEGK
jgi:hypothetical protein